MEQAMHTKIDWNTTFDLLENGHTEPGMRLPDATKKGVAEFRKWWNRYTASRIGFWSPTNTSPRFYDEALSQCTQLDAKNAFQEVSATEIKAFLMYRIHNSPTTIKGKLLHRSMIQSFYKTLQMVYSLDTSMQVPRETNAAVNMVGLVENPSLVIQSNSE